MTNVLKLGTRRIGEFIDFNPDTPKVTVTLEYSENGISVTIPWEDDESTYAQWFTKDFYTFSSKRIATPVPKRVLFQDHDGTVLLIRCFAGECSYSLSGPGSGKLQARAAILGVVQDADYTYPNGLRCEISGLIDWLGVSSWEQKFEKSEPARPSVIISSVNQPVINLGIFNGINAELSQNWYYIPRRNGNDAILKDYVICTTRSIGPREWGEHRNIHNAIRDLLVLSRWHRESCVENAVMRSDDTFANPDGKSPGNEYWHEVVNPGDHLSPPEISGKPHLIKFTDLSEDGILHWFSIRDQFSRALDPVISSIELFTNIRVPNTLLAHTGPGLEALGYLLLQQDGKSDTALRKISLKGYLDRILCDLQDCLPFDGDDWANDMCSAYNGLKHANRDEPDWLEILNVWRQSVLVVRAWVAIKLGIPCDEVKQRLSEDRQSHPYTKLEAYS